MPDLAVEKQNLAVGMPNLAVGTLNLAVGSQMGLGGQVALGGWGIKMGRTERCVRGARCDCG